MNIISFGTDSEFFVFHKKTGKLIPAYKFIKGTKDNPEFICNFGYGELYAHWDNVALEITATPIIQSGGIVNSQLMISYLNTVFSHASSWLRQTFPNYLLSTEPVVHIDGETMFDQEANIFGCDPDYNIWTMDRNPSPSPMKAGSLRTAGTHLHFGFDRVNDDDIITLLKILDLVAGDIVKTLTPESRRKEHLRRTMYGMAGSFRKKDYGVESRVFSPHLYTKLSEFYDLYNKYTMLSSLGIDTVADRDIIDRLVNGKGHAYHNTSPEGIIPIDDLSMFLGA